MNEAVFDSLTGLWDRETSIRYLRQRLCDKQRIVVALGDLDFFINIDSKVGSIEGDKIIARISKFFSTYHELDLNLAGNPKNSPDKDDASASDQKKGPILAKPNYKIGRFNGDCFIFIFQDIHEDDALVYMDELRKRFKKQRFLSEDLIYAKAPISISFGIATGNGDEETVETLLKAAEIALATAKKKGRNRVSCASNDKIRIIVKDLSGVSTVMGGLMGFAGNGGPARDAQIIEPYGVDMIHDSELLIADRGNHMIRRIDNQGIIDTIAGNGSYGYSGDGGCAKKAGLNKPSGVAASIDGTIFIADTGNHCIRKVNTMGIIETLAGCGSDGYEGDSGPGKNAKFSRPGGVVTDKYGRVYTNDYGNNVIRAIKPDGTVYTVAGSGEFGYSGDGGNPLKAALNRPYGLGVTADGAYIYIADYGNHCIREVDVNNNRIRTVCGTGESGYSGDGKDATRARLNGPFWVCVWKERYLLIADAENNCIRIVDRERNIIHTLTGNGMSGYIDSSRLDQTIRYNIPSGMAVDYKNNYLYITDYANNAVRRLNLNYSHY